MKRRYTKFQAQRENILLTANPLVSSSHIHKTATMNYPSHVYKIKPNSTWPVTRSVNPNLDPCYVPVPVPVPADKPPEPVVSCPDWLLPEPSKTAVLRGWFEGPLYVALIAYPPVVCLLTGWYFILRLLAILLLGTYAALQLTSNMTLVSVVRYWLSRGRAPLPPAIDCIYHTPEEASRNLVRYDLYYNRVRWFSVLISLVAIVHLTIGIPLALIPHLLGIASVVSMAGYLVLLFGPRNLIRASSMVTHEISRGIVWFFT